jgi:hypothetical protein
MLSSLHPIPDPRKLTMTPIRPDIPRRGAAHDAGALREARAFRARAIRRRVISGALGLFVATWLLIALVLVSGHDPALAAHTTSAAATSSSTSSSSRRATVTTRSSGSSGAASSGTASSGTVGAVTTRQS